MPGLWTAVGFQRLQAQWQRNTIQLYLPSCHTHHFPKCFTTLMWLELKWKGKVKRFGAQRGRHFQKRNEIRWANGTESRREVRDSGVSWGEEEGRGISKRCQWAGCPRSAVKREYTLYKTQPHRMRKKKIWREESSCLPGFHLYRSQLCIFPKFCYTNCLAGRPSLGRFLILVALAARWKGTGLSSSCRRASAHTRGGLSLQPLSQLADASERALQLSEASGRQCFQTGKQGGMGTPALGVRQRPHLSSAAHTSCEVMG